MEKKRELLIITFLFIIILTLLIISQPFTNNEAPTITKQEEIIENDETNQDEDIDNHDNIFVLNEEKRLDLIVFLLENPVFSAFYYDNVQKLSPATIALYFIDWENNPQLTEEEKTMLAENYETDEWYQLGDYGEIEQYIPIADIEEYFQKMTGLELNSPENEICMKYIPEIEGFIVVCGHGMFNSNIERLTFSSNGDEMLYYIKDVIFQHNDEYIFEIKKYTLLEHLENPSSIILDFINDEITKEEAGLQADKSLYYLMRKHNDSWQFISHSNENF